MAKMHALDAGGGRFRVAMHLVTPVTAPPNQAQTGLTWAQALIRSGRGGTTILADGDGTGGTVSAVEKAEILAGTKYECVVEVLIESATAGERAAFLDAEYDKEQAKFSAKIMTELRWFGLTRG